ncbi:hypothetical protein TrCOL_g8774 [Triparma columacea]|uniref:EF-hand domain-containing protein n=1 Tax=Triparma columacea TaxID=722753 RepID=A0A9W7GJT5_9STRA|nr:hypothetical protein TrCOL_g8774 [Triparma columacea]
MPSNDTGDPNKLSLNSMLLATPARTEDKPSLLPVLSSARKKDEGGKDGGMALIESLATAEVVSIKERQEKEERELISTTSVTQKDVQEFREIFSLVDIDHGGSIDVHELKKLTDLLNIDTSNQEVDDMLREIDSTGTGEVNFIDFVKSMVKKPVVDYSVDDVKAAFKLLAKSDEQKEAGKISSKSLADQLMHLGLPGEQLSKDKVDEILGITETDSTGMINYEEFVQLMMGSKDRGD